MTNYSTKKLGDWKLLAIILLLSVVAFQLLLSVYPIDDLWDFLNNNSGAVQVATTGILVLITIIYASFTGWTTLLFSKQVKSNIEVRVDFLEIPSEERIKEVKKCISEKKVKNFSSQNIYFNLKYSVKNYYAGAGTIDKPSLLMLCKGSIICKLSSPRRNAEWVSMEYCRGGDNHTGGTIYLNGGERRSYVDNFCITVQCGKLENNTWNIFENWKNLNFFVEYESDKGKLRSISIPEEIISIIKND